ncbi:MAG: UPF0301 protein YqgE, partial [uncultured Nocardioidaceae bacterium]
ERGRRAVHPDERGAGFGPAPRRQSVPGRPELRRHRRPAARPRRRRHARRGPQPPLTRGGGRRAAGLGAVGRAARGAVRGRAGQHRRRAGGRRCAGDRGTGADRLPAAVRHRRDHRPGHSSGGACAGGDGTADLRRLLRLGSRPARGRDRRGLVVRRRPHPHRRVRRLPDQAVADRRPPAAERAVVDLDAAGRPGREL